jgi:Tfp pilus assembly protein PilW
MMILRPIQDERGTSLIELMVSSLIFLLVAGGGMRFLILQHQWAVRQEDTAEAQQQVRAALDFMGREIGLLGFGLPEGDAKILKAAGQEVEFLTNLHAAASHLTEATETGQTRLSVRYESGYDHFEKGKAVSICGFDHCERHTLARDGGIDNLELTEGVTNAFPPNSTVQIINQVRYALKPADAAHFKLIRTVDGGANSVAEGLAALELVYLDRAGQATTALVDIRRIQIHLTARMVRTPDKIRFLEAEVYLRNG